MEVPQRKVHIKYPIHLGAPRFFSSFFINLYDPNDPSMKVSDSWSTRRSDDSSCGLSLEHPPFGCPLFALCCRHPIPSQRTGSILPCIISIPQTSSSIRTTNTTTNSAAVHFASHLSSIVATITCNIGHIIVSWNAICIIRWFTTWWKTQQVKDSWCHSWYGIRYFIILSIRCISRNFHSIQLSVTSLRSIAGGKCIVHRAQPSYTNIITLDISILHKLSWRGGFRWSGRSRWRQWRELPTISFRDHGRSWVAI